MDYGNDLIFGSFITPVNTALQEVIALAQASGRAGPGAGARRLVERLSEAESLELLASGGLGRLV